MSTTKDRPGTSVSDATTAVGGAANNRVALRHIFGVRGGQRRNVHYLDEQSVVYTSGKSIVFHNIQQHTQRFIGGPERSGGISYIALAPGRKLLAVAEKSKKPTISVYDTVSLKKRRVLQFSDDSVEEWLSVDFSADSKQIVALAGAPYYHLVYWSWEKGKMLASVPVSTQLTTGPAGPGSSGMSAGAPSASLPGAGQSQIGGSITAPTNFTVTQCSIDPSDASTIFVSGNQVLRIFRYVPETQQLRVVGPTNWGSKRELQHYVCHSWVPGDADGRVLVGTDTGEILVFEGLEFKVKLSQSIGTPISCIIPMRKGFACGGGKGCVWLFDRVEGENIASQSREFYRFSKQCSLFDKQRNERVGGMYSDARDVQVTDLSLDPTEENLIVQTDDNQLLSLNITSAEVMKGDECAFELMSQPFHSQTITGVATCVRKPLVATCSTDRSVRIWNYQENTLEIFKTFSDEAYSVALHPSGLHILIGFHDKLRFCNILMDDIRSVKEFSIRSCSECRFSHGGQYFAAVNGNMIQIFSTYTCENIGNLRGHNGKVRSISWVQGDRHLVSCGIDGAVYEWSLDHFRREGEHVLKICNYSSVVVSQDGQYSYAVGSDRTLKEISQSQVTAEYEVGQHTYTQLAIAYQNRALFAGCEDGSLRAYPFPLTDTFTELPIHAGVVTKMALSHDESLLFTVAEDGSFAMIDVRPMDHITQGTAAAAQRKELPFSEEILVTKSDLEEKMNTISELNTKVEELRLENEYQLRKNELEYNEKMKDMTDNFKIEQQLQGTKYDNLVKEKKTMETEYEDKISKRKEAHEQEVNRLQRNFADKTKLLEERIQSLAREKAALDERWVEQSTLNQEKHERELQEMQDDYDNKLKDERELVEGLQQDKDDLHREHEEVRRQIDEDADKEIEDLRIEYDARLSEEREATLKLKGEFGIMRKKYNSQQRTIEDQNEEIKRQYDKVKELYNTISSLEKDIVAHKKEIKERDETISDKEKRIYDLKKKNQELDKFKFVLDYKIKELKKQIEPKELEINEMKNQIKEMDDELEDYHQRNLSLSLQVSDVQLKIEGQHNEIAKLKNKIRDYERSRANWKADVHECLQAIQDPKLLKERVKKLYQKYVNQSLKHIEFEHDIQSEFNRQREYLEKTNESLKKKLEKVTDAHKKDNQRILQENIALIREINTLRREIKFVKMQAKPEQAGTRKAKRSTLTETRRPESVPSRGENAKDGEVMREMEMQRMLIRRLRERCGELEARLGEQRVQFSRERLPPVDGTVSAGPALVGQRGESTGSAVGSL